MGMSAGKSGELNSEINVTPMVDVMLVLLIIFMVTAPMLQTGVDLDLPQAEAGALPDEQDGTLTLSIGTDRKVFLGDKEIPWAELEVKLSTNARVQRDHELRIEADRSLRYETVIRAMAIAQRAGVTKLLMVTDPLEQGEDGEIPAAEPASGPP